jgi:nitrite reductase/ring-hydroxylating ferredoxin subunit
MSDLPCHRRRFLEVIAHGGVVAGATTLGVGCSSGPSGTYAGGNVSQLQVGDLSPISGGAVALGRDSGGVYAMTLICTHEGCDMASQGSVSPQGISCSCHGSRFDVNGNVLAGPANAPLEHFQVTIDATGAISIDASISVAEATRTPVTG